MKSYLIKKGKPPVSFYTIEEMASLCGRTRHAFLKLVQRGLLPDANYRSPSKVIKAGDNRGGKVEGDRLYSVEVLAPLLIEIFRGIKRGRQITIQQRARLIEAFEKEKKYYSNY